MDAVQRIESLETPAREVPRRTVERELCPGYGIFVGRDQDVRWARLVFRAERARWVASEHWHPQQKGTLQEDGRYVLELPYTDDRELLMDILKYGADVTVLAPEAVRERVVAELARMNDL